MSKNYELLLRIERGATKGAKNELKHSPSGLGPTNAHTLPDVRDRQLTSLVQRLLATDFKNAPRVIAFADVEKQNGSTWICSRTSELLAARASVCAMDLNFDSPGMHSYFGLDNTNGLSNVMFEGCPAEQIVQPVATGPTVITSGMGDFAITAEVADVLSSVISDLRTKFDYILIDAPPINSHAQAAMLSSLADGVILVVQANQTKRDDAKKASRELHAWNVNVIGSILNNRTFPIPENIYRKL